MSLCMRTFSVCAALSRGVFFFFLKKKKCWLFIYLFAAVLGVHCCTQAFSSGCSSLWCEVFSLRWLLLLHSMGSRCAGLVASLHVDSSHTKNQTCVPCIGRLITKRWTTRKVLIRLILKCLLSSLVAQLGKSLPAMQETRVRSMGQEDPLEKEVATHSSILSWRIPWMEEPGGLQSMRLQELHMT